MKNFFMIGCLVLFLASCDSAQEQALKHLENAQALLAEGDLPRAQVELRNAVSKDETLIEAYVLLARLYDEQGEKGRAFAAYRSVIERQPDHLEAARNMALIALDGQALEDAERYGEIARKLAPEDQELAVLWAVLEYQKAGLEKDDIARAQVLKEARRLLEENPNLLRARRLLAADAIRTGDLKQTQTLVDAGLALTPEDRVLNNQRLLVLSRLQDDEAIEAHIRRMIEMFPEDETLDRVLIQFYLHAKRIDDAQAWVLGRIDPTDSEPEARLSYLRFLSELRSAAVMRDALQEMLAQDPLPADIASNMPMFRSMQARVNFSLGQRTQAMSEMESLLADLEADAQDAPEGSKPDQSDAFKVELARMRQQTGNLVGARALVEEVLERDPGQTAALKMKSAWLISEDDTETAVLNLRTALSNAPNDAQALTLMAQAYQREGRADLMADMLARAVEASNQGVAESLRYARYLAGKQELSSAETVLIDALRRRANSPQVLFLLARVHMGMESWGLMRQDIEALRKRFPEDTELQKNVDALQAEMLQRQGRDADLHAFLEGLVLETDGDLGPRIAAIQNTVRQGNLEGAYNDALELEKEAADQPLTAVILAQLESLMGVTNQARERLQELVDNHPLVEQGWTTLYGVERRDGRTEAAKEVLVQGLEALPDSRLLNLTKAQDDEAAGDIEAAIAIYEKLYEQNTSDVIVANNLASLLTAARKDQASLDRAWIVARRLNGTQHPAFRDTYGWLAFLRGDTQAALRELKPAAEGLPQDPSVAYHLGRAYEEVGQIEEAQAEYSRARELIVQGAKSYPGLVDDIKTQQENLLAKAQESQN